jgi:hypothetical protein
MQMRVNAGVGIVVLAKLFDMVIGPLHTRRALAGTWSMRSSMEEKPVSVVVFICRGFL